MSGGKASRDKGARYERAIVDWFIRKGRRQVERRIMGMAADKGDLTGLPGWVIECKDHAQITLGAFVKQMEAERLEANARHGAVFIKRRGYGDVGCHYVVMTADDWLDLMTEAGW